MNLKLSRAMKYEKLGGTFGRDRNSLGCGHARYYCLLCKQVVCEAMLKLHRQKCRLPILLPRY